MTIKERYDRLHSRRDLVAQRLDSVQTDLEEARANRLDIDVVQQIVQTSATFIQNEFGTYIGDIVTKAMHHVFPERANDRFFLRFRENRGRTECQLLIQSKDGTEKHPFHCSGGGLVDVLALALRAAIVVLEEPQRSRFMICDEPFKFLHSAEGRMKALDMLYNTCDTLGIQCLMVHQSNSVLGDDKILKDYANSGKARVYVVKQIAYQTSIIEELDND